MYDSNETMLAKLQAEAAAHSVIYPSDYMVQRMVELGLLRQLEPARLSGLNNLSLRFQNPSYDLNNRHSVPLAGDNRLPLQHAEASNRAGRLGLSLGASARTIEADGVAE